MTHTESLSARIAALEAQAAPLPELNAELVTLVDRCNAVSAQIQDAVRPHHLLAGLETHAAYLLGEGEALAVVSSPPELPEAVTPEETAPALHIVDYPDAIFDPARGKEVSIQPPKERARKTEQRAARTPSQHDRLLDWVRGLPAGATLTAESAGEALGFPASSCSQYLRAAVRLGLLEMTTAPRERATYRRTGDMSIPAPAPEPAPEAPQPAPEPIQTPESPPLPPEPPQPTPEPEVPEPEEVAAEPEPPVPAPAAPVQVKPVIRDHLPRPVGVKQTSEARQAALPRDLPPVPVAAVTASDVEVEIVQGALKKHGRPMSKSLLLGRVSRAGIKTATLDDALAQLVTQGNAVETDAGFFGLAARREAV